MFAGVEEPTVQVGAASDLPRFIRFQRGITFQLSYEDGRRSILAIGRSIEERFFRIPSK